MNNAQKKELRCLLLNGKNKTLSLKKEQDIVFAFECENIVECNGIGGAIDYIRNSINPNVGFVSGLKVLPFVTHYQGKKRVYSIFDVIGYMESN